MGHGQFQKWETSGQEFEGTWHGMHEGRFGALGTLDTVDGRLTFPLPVALRDRLARVHVGPLCSSAIGLQTSNAGRTFKGFEVFVAEQDGWSETPVLVNTSFKVWGQPIVCTPEDAFRCFMGTEIEVLVIGNCYLRKEDQHPQLTLHYKSAFTLD